MKKLNLTVFGIKIRRDISILILGRILQTVLSLIALRIITTILSPTEVGNYYLIIAICFFFSYILLNPVATYFSRELVAIEKNKLLKNAVISFILFATSASVLAVAISLLLFNELRYDEKFIKIEFLIVISISVSVSAIHRSVLTGINVLRP